MKMRHSWQRQSFSFFDLRKEPIIMIEQFDNRFNLACNNECMEFNKKSRVRLRKSFIIHS
jgi:hypothetical protein